MPQLLTCPKCRTLMSVADGTVSPAVLCPGCKIQLLLPRPAPKPANPAAITTPPPLPFLVNELPRPTPPPLPSTAPLLNVPNVVQAARSMPARDHSAPIPFADVLPPPPPIDLEPFEKDPTRDKDRYKRAPPAWRRVDLGLVGMQLGVLATIIWGVFNILSGLAQVFYHLLADHTTAAEPVPQTIFHHVMDGILWFLRNGLPILAALLFVSGRLIFCAMPAKSGARGLAWTSFASTSLALGLLAFSISLLLLPYPPVKLAILSFIACGALAFVAEILFQLALSRMGQYVRRPYVGASVTRFWVTLAAMILGGVILQFVLSWFLAEMTLGGPVATEGSRNTWAALDLAAATVVAIILFLYVMAMQCITLALYLRILEDGRDSIRRLTFEE